MTEVFLGVIAAATAVTAVIQVMVLLNLAKTAKQVLKATEDLQRDAAPVLARARQIADDAAQAAALARVQLERVDALMIKVTTRIDDTLAEVQSAVVQPIRTGAALFAGLRAALSMFTSTRERDRPAQDDDDGMFVG